MDDACIPAVLKEFSKKEFLKLLGIFGVNWLPNDGIWFQAIETTEEFFTAKRFNDTCWTKFSPYEAFRIKKLLNLPEDGGISALALRSHIECIPGSTGGLLRI